MTGVLKKNNYFSVCIVCGSH